MIGATSRTGFAQQRFELRRARVQQVDDRRRHRRAVARRHESRSTRCARAGRQSRRDRARLRPSTIPRPRVGVACDRARRASAACSRDPHVRTGNSMSIDCIGPSCAVFATCVVVMRARAPSVWRASSCICSTGVSSSASVAGACDKQAQRTPGRRQRRMRRRIRERRAVRARAVLAQYARELQHQCLEVGRNGVARGCACRHRSRAPLREMHPSG